MAGGNSPAALINGKSVHNDCEFVEIEFEASLKSYSDYVHAAHCMIYSRDPKILWNQYIIRANVMMQVRFDGLFGFPGGLHDKTDGEIVVGLNRELHEEINLDSGLCKFEQSDHLITHVCHSGRLVTHFYAKELSLDVYKKIENAVMGAHEWGIETMGITRVPLYTLKDGFRGFPLFLKNRFAGNALSQLLIGLRQCKILSEEELHAVQKL